MKETKELERLRALEADLREMMVRCGFHKGDSGWLDNGGLFCEVLTLLDRHNVLPEQEERSSSPQL